ncbi:MAG: hypothetical protein P4M08_12465 [Oligoflexia bacterium]|nr:hypothetical protein [Oligoflexia bacterium]
MKRLFGLIITALLASSASAWAYSPGSGFVGGELGYGIVTSGGGADLNYGPVFGYAPSPTVLVSGFFNYLPRGTIADGNGNTASGSLKLLGGDIAFSPPNWLGASFGGRAAYGINNTNFNGASQTEKGVYFGPQLTYQIQLAIATTLDAEVYYLFTTANSSNSIVGFQGCVRFWF